MSSNVFGVVASYEDMFERFVCTSRKKNRPEMKLIQLYLEEYLLQDIKVCIEIHAISCPKQHDMVSNIFSSNPIHHHFRTKHCTKLSCRWSNDFVSEFFVNSLRNGFTD